MEIFDFRCKYCGGELHEVEGAKSVGKCKYCGSKQTLPKLYSEKRATLFGRANHMRRNNEFDKAEALYEQILNEDPSDPEAYWSLVLCRFGIEYVEDTNTKERKPTVNRTQMTSVFADENYKSAIKNADDEQRKLYEHEANVINDIQKGILEISQKEEPFDVFICYKETDEKGKRSKDSVLAHDLYRELTRDGYKVFFARETLSGRMGLAYEPYIFSALNSAKVMVVLGTKKEYFEAVWVRNEWSRFLGQIKNGEKKTLIPVYKDIDAYDLPQEFSNLQAVNMDRVGYLQELISGVENIVKIYHHKDEEAHEESANGKKKKKYPVAILAAVLILAAVIGITAFSLLRQDTPVLPNGDITETTSDNGKAENTVATLKNEMYHVNISSDGASLPADGVVNVDEIKDGAEHTMISDALPENIKRFFAYDISITSEGKPYSPNGEITVTLPLPDGIDSTKAAVYYVSESGKAEEHKCNASGGNISFVTTHFSIYVIAEKTVSDFSYTENSDGSISVSGYHGSSDTIIIPEAIDGKTVTAIAAKAFDSMDSLISVTIPESVTAIGANAFYGCTSIKTITIPETVESMGVTVFYGWSAQQTIIVGGHSSNPTEWNSRWNTNCDATIIYSLKKIEFDANGGNGSMTAIYAEMNHLSALPNCTFTKAGYTFAGWALSADGETAVAPDGGFNLGSDDKYTLYAVWTANENILSFDANGGSGEMEDIRINSDKTVTLPASSFKKDGYTFAGWSTAKNGIVLYADESVYTMGVSASNTLYAVWAPNSNVVIFNANGAAGSMEPQSIKTDETASLTANTFTKAGYTFEGWSETKDGTVKYEDGASFTMSSSESVTLYAVWGANTNKITLYANNGTTEKTVINGTTDSIITLPKNTYERAGYVFVGWGATADGNAVYDDEAEYAVASDNAQLYAIWSANENTLVFDANGGTGEMANMAVKTDSTATLTACGFDKAGYAFAGWSTARDGEAVYGDCAEYIMGPNEKYTLYAVWTIKEYKITYNLNGGENSTANPESFDIETDTFTLNAPARTGYTFKGWYDSEELDTAVTAIEKGTHTDIQLWAKWEANTYSVTFDANGGTLSVESERVAFGSEYIMPIPEKSGYTFGGWYNGDTRYESGLWETSEDITLTALWTANTDTKYTVKHYWENTHNSEYTLFEQEERHGTTDTSVSVEPKAYTGFTSPSAKTATILPDGSAVVEYYYTRNTYTVAVVANSSDVYPSVTKKYQAQIGITPVREGYTFGGWFTDADLTVPCNGLMPDGGTIYAWWQEETKAGEFIYSGSSFVYIHEYKGSSENVRIPEYIGGVYVAEILSRAFANGSNVKSIVVPDSVSYIEGGAFYGCGSLERITLPFVGSSIKTDADTYQYPLGHIFGTSEYAGGMATVQVYYGASTSENVEETFYIPASLRTVTVTGGNILRGAFRGCSSLIEINLPSNITSIAANAFYECKGLVSITIPEGVTSIGDWAFALCGNLVEIYNKSSLSVNSGMAWLATRALNVYTPLNGSSKLDITDDGFVFYADADKVYLVGYYGAESNISLPEGYNGSQYEIYKYAFCNWTELEGIVIPNGVTGIGDSAFEGCVNLTGVTIPSTVTRIGYSAFEGCTKAIALLSGISYVDNWVVKSDVSIASAKIKDGTIGIAESAFETRKQLTEITIPNTVIMIGEEAFYNCTALSGITFNGTKAEWDAILKGTNWNRNAVINQIICSDGQITEIV